MQEWCRCSRPLVRNILDGCEELCVVGSSVSMLCIDREVVWMYAAAGDSDDVLILLSRLRLSI